MLKNKTSLIIKSPSIAGSERDQQFETPDSPANNPLTMFKKKFNLRNKSYSSYGQDKHNRKSTNLSQSSYTSHYKKRSTLGDGLSVVSNSFYGSKARDSIEVGQRLSVASRGGVDKVRRSSEMLV